MPDWRDCRRYQHLDNLCTAKFIKMCQKPEFVAKHSWCPLIFFEKSTKRFSQKDGKTKCKLRPIMYASHRDAAIFGRYASLLTAELEGFYKENRLSEAVIAYRKLGLANYHFAAEVETFVRGNCPCVVLCFDVTKFFDTLNHKYLKGQIRKLLKVEQLADDWYAVFKALTKFHYVRKDALATVPKFAAVMRAGFPKRIGSIQDIIKSGVKIHKNGEKFGIPQGTPISAVMSNIYMMQLDLEMHRFASSCSGLYRRYSDDILMVVPAGKRADAQCLLSKAIAEIHLRLNDDKTEINVASTAHDITYQYLGFIVDKKGALIRGSSLSRQGRKIKYGVRKIGRDGKKAISLGKSTKVYVKRLRTRFTQPSGRNFANYARRASHAFATKRIARQALRLEVRADRLIREL